MPRERHRFVQGRIGRDPLILVAWDVTNNRSRRFVGGWLNHDEFPPIHAADLPRNLSCGCGLKLGGRKRVALCSGSPRNESIPMRFAIRETGASSTLLRIPPISNRRLVDIMAIPGKPDDVAADRLRHTGSAISGPLLDRINLHVNVPLVEFRELSASSVGEESPSICGRVVAAREIHRPSSISGKHRLSGARDGAVQFLRPRPDPNVARALADLEDSPDIRPDHVLEATQYRTLDRNLFH